MDSALNTHNNIFKYRFLINQPTADAILQGIVSPEKFKEEFKCDISISICTGPDRILVIFSDIDSLCSALIKIFDISKSFMHSNFNKPEAIVTGNIQDDIVSEEMDLRLLLSENISEDLIIKMSKEFSLSVFKVYRQMCPASTDHVIRMVGYPIEIIKGFRGISEHIQNIKTTKSAREYDPSNFNEIHAVNYGGWMSLEGILKLNKSSGPPPPTEGHTPSGKIPKAQAKINSRDDKSIAGKRIKSLQNKIKGTVIPIFTGLNLTFGEMENRLYSQNIMIDVSNIHSSNGRMQSHMGPYVYKSVMEGLSFGQMTEKLFSKSILMGISEERSQHKTDWWQ